jgi:ribonuclease PH
LLTATKKSFSYGAHTVTLETGEIARQAHGAVLVNMDETVVLATVVAAKEPKPGQDFFPLTVDYMEKTYAAGKIPGGFFKREGRPSEKEILTCRLIDRRSARSSRMASTTTCRSSHRAVEQPRDRSRHPGDDRRSAALSISGIPFNGPIGAARVGYANGQYVLNPTISELKDSQLNLVVAGTESAVLMVESEAQELPRTSCSAPWCSATSRCRRPSTPSTNWSEVAGKPEWDWQPPAKDEALIAKVAELAEAELRAPTSSRRSRRACSVGEGSALEAVSQAACRPTLPPERDQPRQATSSSTRSEDRAQPDPRRRAAHRRPRHAHRAPDRDPPRRAAAHPRLLAVHPRRDAGAGGGHAGHRPRRADHRRAAGRVPRPLHAPLQHAALRHRRDGPRRQRRSVARSATAAWPSAPCWRCCRRPRSSATPCASSRRSPSRTAPVDGLRLRRLAWR